MVPEKGWLCSIEINTLGRFEIIKEGLPLRFSRKVPKRPLLLLKTLITHGGSMREEKLCDLLWPDSEGDAAYKALEITVIRLRKVLGSKEAVEHRGGNVWLVKDICRTDVRAFEELLDQAITARQQGNVAVAKELFEKASKLYKGPFLSGEPEFWMIPFRERLAKRFRQAANHNRF